MTECQTSKIKCGNVMKLGKKERKELKSSQLLFMWESHVGRTTEERILN